MDLAQISLPGALCEPLNEMDRQLKVRSLRDLLANYEKPSERFCEMAVGRPALTLLSRFAWMRACSKRKQRSAD